MNCTKHYLKLNINKTPEDRLRDYITLCTAQVVNQPTELKTAMKDIFKFLAWKLTIAPDDFSDNDATVISNRKFNQFFDLSPKSCKYTKNIINKYTEIIWQNKVRNETLMNGESNIPRPSCSRLPIPVHTSRRDEVLLMSLMYPQNLMNSFVYRHTYTIESPLCPRCRMDEQTPYHVIFQCNDHSEEIKQLMIEILGEEAAHEADSTTILNCSRDPRFIQICLIILQEGEFRTEIDL